MNFRMRGFNMKPFVDSSVVILSMLSGSAIADEGAPLIRNITLASASFPESKIEQASIIDDEFLCPCPVIPLPWQSLLKRAAKISWITDKQPIKQLFCGLYADPIDKMLECMLHN